MLKLISSAKKELRIVVPFYDEETIRAILDSSLHNVTKYFVLALSDRGVKGKSQSVSALGLLMKDRSCVVRFAKPLRQNF